MRTSKVINPMRPDTVRSVEDARAHADRWLQQGFGGACNAFNLLDDPNLRYTWDADTRAQALHCLKGLIGLLHSGKIQLRSGAVAQDDRSFQAFLRSIKTNEPQS